MLRERTTGTLERLMSLPLAKLDLLAGYDIAFGALAAAQAIVVCGQRDGVPPARTVGPARSGARGSARDRQRTARRSLGLFLSAFARSEFQAVQFMPAFVLPQLLLCGLFVSRDEMTAALHAVSWVLAFTYAYDALACVTCPGSLGVGLALDAGVIVLATVGAPTLGAITLRRRTP